MKIKRENDIDDVFFKFRMALSFRKFDLMKDFLDVNFECEINKMKSRIIVIIDIENNITPERIKTVVKNYKLKPKDFDIFIGITSSYDMGGLTVPESVLNIIKIIDCDLHFSFVSGPFEG